MTCQSPSDLARDTFANAMQDGVRKEQIGQVFPPVINLLLGGTPVPVDKIAERADLPTDRIELVLEELGAERNEKGEVTGLGLTLEPTPHEYRADGKTLYTWCAPDALLFPKMLGHTARVVSSDPVTEETVTLTVSPEGVEEVSPSTAVVSWTRKADGRDIRGTFCRYGRFFADRAAAKQWKREHPNIEILSVQEALAAIRQMDALL